MSRQTDHDGSRVQGGTRERVPGTSGDVLRVAGLDALVPLDEARRDLDLAARYCLAALSDEELYAAMSDAAADDRDAVLDLVWWPGGDVPPPAALPALRDEALALAPDDRADAVVALARQDAAALEGAVGTAATSEAVVAAADALYARVGGARTRLAALCAGATNDAGTWPLCVVATRSAAADPRFAPLSRHDLSGLARLLPRLRDHVAAGGTAGSHPPGDPTATGHLAGDLAEGRFGRTRDLLERDVTTLRRAGRPVAAMAEALDLLALGLGLPPLPDRVSVDDLAARFLEARAVTSAFARHADPTRRADHGHPDPGSRALAPDTAATPDTPGAPGTPTEAGTAAPTEATATPAEADAEADRPGESEEPADGNRPRKGPPADDPPRDEDGRHDDGRQDDGRQDDGRQDDRGQHRDDGPQGDDGLEVLERSERLEAQVTPEGRHGLAHHVAALTQAPARRHAHAALALAEALRSGTGPAAGAAIAHMSRLDRHLLEHDKASAHLALAAALRAAVHTPALEVQALLEHVRTCWSHHAGATTLLEAALRAARAGLSVSAEAKALRDRANLDADLARARDGATYELRRASSRTNKYSAATNVWTSWVRRDGLLGRLLVAASEDDRSRLDEVGREVNRLRDRQALVAAIRDADRRVRRRNEITAGARDRLIDWSEQVVGLAAAWVEAARAHDAATRQGGTPELLVRLQVAARSCDLEGAFALDHPDPVVAACARAAEGSVGTTLGLFEAPDSGDAGPEPEPRQVLDGDLLLAAGPRLGPSGPDRPPTVAELECAAAADADDVACWREAFDRRAKARDHEGTERIVGRVRALDPLGAESLATDRVEALTRDRIMTGRRRTAVSNRLAAARSHGHVDSDIEWARLTGELEALDPSGRLDLGRVNARLDEVDATLDRARRAAVGELEAVLAGEVERGTVDDGAARRIRDRIAADDIATAREYVALARDHQALPPVPEADTTFSSWWPERAGRLAEVIVDSCLVGAARAGPCLGPLPIGHLSPTGRRDAAAGLDAWMKLSVGKPPGQLITAAKPVLTLLGMEATDFSGGAGRPSTSEREWRQLVGARRSGRPLVPDFGSHSSGAATGDTMLCLLVWKEPKPTTLVSWICQEQSRRPVMVWYFGRLSRRDRARLAAELRGAGNRRPVVVVDDAVVTYMAAADTRNYEVLMRLTLPFAAVNPYRPVGGLTPVEMFYGRDTERRALTDLTGSALVYGGRQLGKSSLLRAAQREFDDGIHRRAVYLDLKANSIGSIRPPSGIWQLLWEALADIGVLAGEPPAAQLRRKLREAISGWLDAAPGRALLVLLDECDQFLDLDARERFATVDGLKGLMSQAQRRVKFVLAGLHKVQRFTSVENQPLAHLGNPIAVGPLRPAEAMELVTAPTAALGYSFDSPELPARILAVCNNNPGLIVLFMQALLERMLDAPFLRPGRDGPPVDITDRDVEETYANDSRLAEQIRERFELTLDLDPAYKVIAYTMAHEHREAGGGSGALTLRELRARAVGWWPAGFAGLSFDGFRSLCDELIDLGVLAHRDNAYCLRSPNILRFLGSADQIAELLLGAEGLRRAGSFDAASARRRLGSDPARRSPLTEAQVAHVLAEQNQVTLVVGTPLTGIDDVTDILHQAAGESHVDVSDLDPATAQPVRYLNTTGKHRMLLVELREVEGARAARLVADAVRACQARGAGEGTVGFVLVAGLDHLDLWRAAVEGGDHWEGVGIVELRRVDEEGWLHWRRDDDALPVADGANAQDLLEVSGGWLRLLEDAAAEARDAGSREAVGSLTARAGDPDGARALLAGAGVGEGRLAAAFRGVCHYCGDGATLEDTATAVALGLADGDAYDTGGESNGGGARDSGGSGGDAPGDGDEGTEVDVELLRMLGVLQVGAEGGTFRPQPVMARALRTVLGAAAGG